MSFLSVPDTELLREAASIWPANIAQLGLWTKFWGWHKEKQKLSARTLACPPFFPLVLPFLPSKARRIPTFQTLNPSTHLSLEFTLIMHRVWPYLAHMS